VVEEASHSGRAQRHGLYASDKENRPLVEKLPTKRPSSGALWEQLCEVEGLRAKLAHQEKLRLQAEVQLSELRGSRRSAAELRALTDTQAKQISELERRCQDLDALQQGAMEKAKQENLRAAALEAALLDKTQELKNQQQHKPAEVETVLRGKVEHLTAMQSELTELARRIELTEARFKTRHEAPILCKHGGDPGGVSVNRHRLLASHVAHCAVVKALVVEEAERQTLPDEVQKALRDDLAKAEAEVQAARADEQRQLYDICQKKVQLGVQVVELKAEVAKLEEEKQSWQNAENKQSCREGHEEELLAQNKHLMDTNAMLRQECECLRAENQSLKATVVMFEESLEKASCQNAQLAGHANHRQKIKHIEQLKEQLKDERDRFRMESQNLKLRLRRAEANTANRNLIAAMLGPRETEIGSKMGKTILRLGPETEVSETARSQRLEQQLERITINFRHLLDLIEYAVSAGGRTGASEIGLDGLLDELRQLVMRQRSLRVSAEPGPA